MSAPQADDKKAYLYLPYIISLYTFFFILPALLLNRIVTLPLVGTLPISVFFTGIYFVLLDVATEVYGYWQGRTLVFTGLITYTVFMLIMEFVLHLPQAQNYGEPWGFDQDPFAYTYLFHNLHRAWFSVVFCTLLANNLNIVFLSKWKILMRGKYFWLRSLTTSLIAVTIYSALSNFMIFGMLLKPSQYSYYFQLILTSILAKLFTLFIFAYPSVVFCNFLKKKEGVDVYDYNLSLNPFKSQKPEDQCAQQ